MAAISAAKLRNLHQTPTCPPGALDLNYGPKGQLAVVLTCEYVVRKARLSMNKWSIILVEEQ